MKLSSFLKFLFKTYANGFIFFGSFTKKTFFYFLLMQWDFIQPKLPPIPPDSKIDVLFYFRKQ